MNGEPGIVELKPVRGSGEETVSGSLLLPPTLRMGIERPRE